MKKAVKWICLLILTVVIGTGCGQTAGKESTGKQAGTEEEAASEQAGTEEEAASEQAAPEERDYAKFAGDWYVDGSLENGHLSIDKNGHVESYSYDDMFNYEGELKREEYENPDGSKGFLYNIYDDGGEFVTGFYEPEEEDFYELYSGQDGEVRYVRSDHCTGTS